MVMLGRNYGMDALLITENCEGELLSDAILETIHSGDRDRLFWRLTRLAHFLSVFHNRTANGVGVDFNQDCAYLDTLTNKLRKLGATKVEDTHELCWLRDQWRVQSRMWEDQQVLVHGDATPENFIFGGGKSVVGLDLERAKRADRVFDIGRIAGELKHFFMRWTGSRDNAEPFIGHFLWEYACHFPNRDRAFRSITSRIPFYMGMTLLRISRNDWVDTGYRHTLIHEAKLCLRSY
jgi:aminoglycoside phosphotransferase (APT) family kinase protein